MIDRHLRSVRTGVHVHAGSDTLILDRKLVNLFRAYCTNLTKLSIHDRMLFVSFFLSTTSKNLHLQSLILLLPSSGR
jgi:hypothetical protein